MTMQSASEMAAAPFFDALVRDALHSLRMALGMEVAFISEFRDGQRVIQCVDADASFVARLEGAAHPLEESYCQRIVDGRLPELMPDTAQFPEAFCLPVTAELSIGTYLGVPIRIGEGRVHGTFCCFGSQPNARLDQRDLKMMNLFADFVGKMLDRQAAAERARQAVLERLRRVLDERRFHIVYQPIVNVALHETVGYEALTRFTAEPARSPDQWFNEASEVGLQEELELAVIREALAGLAHFPAETYLSLNVSPETILKGRVGTALAGYPLQRLVLEVTEHASVSDYAQIAELLAPLRREGLGLAVDDAGAGFASFRHILKLKPDVIKLDVSLIRRIDQDRGRRALAAALVRFAEESGSKVVAEGVETEAELAVLRELKVNKAQGYLLGRPQPIAGIG